MMNRSGLTHTCDDDVARIHKQFQRTIEAATTITKKLGRQKFPVQKLTNDGKYRNYTRICLCLAYRQPKKGGSALRIMAEDLPLSAELNERTTATGYRVCTVRAQTEPSGRFVERSTASALTDDRRTVYTHSSRSCRAAYSGASYCGLVVPVG
jgi:hypothetical protein